MRTSRAERRAAASADRLTDAAASAGRPAPGRTDSGTTHRVALVAVALLPNRLTD